MSGLGASLAKKVGPMPLGAWLLVGAGGLWIAHRGQSQQAAAPAAADPSPVTASPGSFDGAPLVLSPIIQVQPANVTIPSAPVTLPTPTPTPTTPASAPPKTTIPAPAPHPQVITYTIRKGDTLWAIAKRFLGSGVLWPKVYAQNRTTIETAARQHHYSSSRNGALIFPGTVLRITK